MKLDLRDCALTDRHIKTLEKCTTQLQIEFTELLLDDNCITDEGILMHLLKMIAHTCYPMQVLSLENNQCSVRSLCAVLGALSTHP